MLARKRELERLNQTVATNNMISYELWIADALALLLQLELDRQKS